MSSIFKFKGNRFYAKISNNLLQNPKLSLKARGLMAYILSLPDTWEINVEHLHKEASEHDGRTAVQGAMAELRALGYLQLEPKRADGKICGSHWIAFDDPSENVAAQFNVSDKQVSRQAENLSAEKPTAIKEIEDIKETTEKKGHITPIVPLPPISHELQPWEIYEAYPLKKARGSALKSITKELTKVRKEGGIGAAKLLEITQEYADVVAQWPESERKFIPHASTWFNQERYTDDQSTWKRQQNTKGRAGWL